MPPKLSNKYRNQCDVNYSGFTIKKCKSKLDRREAILGKGSIVLIVPRITRLFVSWSGAEARRSIVEGGETFSVPLVALAAPRALRTATPKHAACYKKQATRYRCPNRQPHDKWQCFFDPTAAPDELSGRK